MKKWLWWGSLLLSLTLPALAQPKEIPAAELDNIRKQADEIRQLEEQYAKESKDDRAKASKIGSAIRDKREELEEIWKKYRPVTGQPDNTTCGPTSAHMAIEAVTGKDIPVDQLAKEAKTNDGEGVIGTETGPLTSAIQQHGVDAETRAIDSCKDLTVTPTTPAVVWVVTGMNETHIVVIDWIWEAADKKTKLVHFRDPQNEFSGFQTAEQFDKTLKRNGKEQGAAIVLKGPASPQTAPKPKDEPGVKDKTGAYLAPEQLQNYAFTLQGSGLGDVAVSCSNPTDQPLTLCLEPGIVCLPSNDAFQQMLMVGGLELVVPPKGSASREFPLLALSGPSLVSDAGARHPSVSAVCTQFYKKVPNSGVTFTPTACTDPGLLRLARFFAKEPLRGPWDQGATWIVTDHLTKEQMNTRLVPALSSWTYLRALRIAGQEGGVNYQDPNWRPCLDPELLLDPKDLDRDVAWFVQTADPEALKAWLETNWAQLTAPSNELKVSEHRCDLGAALCRLDNPTLRGQGTRLLVEGINPAHRAAVAPRLKGLPQAP